MPDLTKRQRQVLDFIQDKQRDSGTAPTFQEIADHFGFKSPNAVSTHVQLLRKKGVLAHADGRPRSLRVLSPLTNLRKRVADIPIFGSIPAGPPAERRQEAKGCVTIDIETLGSKPSPLAFALVVDGDSMIGKHIAPGDSVVIEPRANPKNGDVVAALIDGETTLKTLVMRGSKPFLRAENPKYPDLVPAAELVIQGVAITIVRKLR